MMNYRLVVLAWLIAPLVGCGRVPPQGAKALTEIGTEAVKEAVKYGQQRLREDQERHRQESEARLRESLAASSQRFPYPVNTVTPISNTPDFVDQTTGAYILRNNYGGHNFYDANGNPKMFSALDKKTGLVRFFDVSGFPIR